MGSGRLTASSDSCEMNWSGSIVSREFVGDFGSGDGGLGLALNHICDCD